MREETRVKIVTVLNRCIVVFCCISLVIAVYLASQNAGLNDGTFGPGSYYYSDIPGWEKIFLSESTWHLGFENPVAAYGFFVIWGLLSFTAWRWLDKKLK